MTPDFRALSLKCCNPICVQLESVARKILKETKEHPWYLKKETVEELEEILKYPLGC